MPGLGLYTADVEGMPGHTMLVTLGLVLISLLVMFGN